MTQATLDIPGSLVYHGQVVHKRLRPFQHHLAYRVFSVLLDVDDLPGLSRRLRMFGHNRWAPISVHDRDYGRRDGSSIRSWVDEKLQDFGHGNLVGGPLRLLTFPRLWGYAFNPLSIHFCYGPDGHLGAVLYEVSNTFGESHGYLIPVETNGDPIHQQTNKVFHVSPFLEMNCRYHFALRAPGEKLGVIIRQTDSSGAPILIARQTAKGERLTDKSLARALMRHPLMTAKVIGAIHWEAVKLWLKGARYYPKPPLPTDHVTR